MTETLEMLRQLVRDDTTVHVGLGQVQDVDVATDRSGVLVKVELWPSGRIVIARMTWTDVGAGTGSIRLPVAKQLVVVVFCDGSKDQAFVIGRLSTKQDFLSAQAADGHSWDKAHPGKKAYLASDTAVLLGRGGDDDADEPLILGNVFKEAFSEFLGQYLEHTHICSAPGAPSLPPLTATETAALKASPVDDGVMLSGIAFTES